MKCLYVTLILLTGCSDKQSIKTAIEAKAPLEQITKPFAVKPFSNPALVYGSDFISFLAMLQVTEPDNYDTLLYYTSSISKAEYSKEAIIYYYATTNLAFTKKLKAMRKKDSLYILSYISLLNATKTLRTFTVSIENDTCRLMVKCK